MNIRKLGFDWSLGFGHWGLTFVMAYFSQEVGLVYHPLMFKHDTGANHPERPARLSTTFNLLKESKVLERLELLEPQEAPLKIIGLVHPQEYIKTVKDLSAKSDYLDLDTPLSPLSYQAARLAIGGITLALDEILSSKLKRAFALVRPPGHHALESKGMGFCLFNNLAIGARYSQKTYGLSKILIIDFDAHHGNGLQEIFYDDPSVFYISFHQAPLYPGTGRKEETGQGKGLGFTFNLPFPPGSGDETFLKAFEEEIFPAALKFKPELIMVAAGYDGHRDDPLAGLNLTVAGYAKLAAKTKELANLLCQDRLLLSLEGGYNLQALSQSVLATLQSLL